MQSPQYLQNGETPARLLSPHFHSTVFVQRLRRFNILILIFRLASFSFTFASAVFTATNSRGSTSASWLDFAAFRFLLAANAIVALYSFIEMGASIWEIFKGTTVFRESTQVWFDFVLDQVLAYMILTAETAAAEVARNFRSRGETCNGRNAFCVQSAISIALGLVGFLFLGVSALLSGFRLVSFIIYGSRFRL